MSFMTYPWESHTFTSAAFHWTHQTAIIQFRRVLPNYKEGRMVGGPFRGWIPQFTLWPLMLYIPSSFKIHSLPLKTLKCYPIIALAWSSRFHHLHQAMCRWGWYSSGVFPWVYLLECSFFQSKGLWTRDSYLSPLPTTTIHTHTHILSGVVNMQWWDRHSVIGIECSIQKRENRMYVGLIGS